MELSPGGERRGTGGERDRSLATRVTEGETTCWAARQKHGAETDGTRTRSGGLLCCGEPHSVEDRPGDRGESRGDRGESRGESRVFTLS